MKRIGWLVSGVWLALGAPAAQAAAFAGGDDPAGYCVFFERQDKGQEDWRRFFAASVASEAEALVVLAKSGGVEGAAIVPRSCTDVGESLMVPKLWAPVCADFPAGGTEYANVMLLKREVLLSASKLGEVESRFAYGLCPPTVQLSRKDAQRIVEVSPGDLVSIQLDRGPVSPCAGGPWSPDSLRIDGEVLRLERFLVVDNPDCPEGMVGCQRELDEVRLRVVGKYPALVYLEMEPAPDFCEAKTPRDFWVVLQ